MSSGWGRRARCTSSRSRRPRPLRFLSPTATRGVAGGDENQRWGRYVRRVDFSYPAEAEAFRAEFRAWLEAHADPGVRGVQLHQLEPGSEALERTRAWNRTLADARYAAIAAPEEYGGRRAGPGDQVVY